MQAVDEEFEVKQAKDMAAAKKRWEALVLFLILLRSYYFYNINHYLGVYSS